MTVTDIDVSGIGFVCTSGFDFEPIESFDLIDEKDLYGFLKIECAQRVKKRLPGCSLS